MKSDVMRILNGQTGTKRPSKETLNHPGIILMATGLDPFVETRQAFLEAYRKLGIDIINRAPEKMAPRPTPPGAVLQHDQRYRRSYLGVYDTYSRFSYPFADCDELFRAGEVHLDYAALITPVPHRLDLPTIHRKEKMVGEIGIYYYQLYTTLFMWGVEELGWEVFLTAAMSDPQAFDQIFFAPAFAYTQNLLKILVQADIPFVFLHDDLADARGPICRPSFYDDYIFPRYQIMCDYIHQQGKKIVFVADGNMTELLPALKTAGVDGVMIETPATPLEKLLDCFDKKIVIGGIDTKELTFGTPASVKAHVAAVGQQTSGCPGFVLSASGGLHGNIPLANLEAYFDARIETGHTPADWKQLALPDAQSKLEQMLSRI